MAEAIHMVLPHWMHSIELITSLEIMLDIKQCEYERKVAGILKEAPKVFHSYIRIKKKGCITVGPLKFANVSVSITGRKLSYIFTQALSSVNVSTVPENPHPFQNFNGNIEVLDANYEAVVSILEALNGSPSSGLCS